MPRTNKLFQSIFMSLLILFSLATAAHAEVEFKQRFSNLTFERPILITHANDQSNRLFVVEQGGTIQAFTNHDAVKETQLFFDMQKTVKNKFIDGGEQGLLGLAFDPDFSTNGFFYVNYTATEPRRTVISRFKVPSAKPNTADYQSEKELLVIEQDYPNHNGGMLAFGPDGYLYIGMGDGGSGGDPKNRAQDGRSLLGKMLRIDRNGQAPKDNPFINEPKLRDEIWALGLRNPWRFSFDAKTQQLWLADVGQSKLEEVNLIEKGGNYGWNWFEGTEPFKVKVPNTKNFIEPIFEYGRKEGRSITGGYVYRGKQFPQLQGWYFFGDFASSNMWALDGETFAPMELDKVRNPSSFGEDEQGELYVVSYLGNIYQITDANRSN